MYAKRLYLPSWPLWHAAWSSHSSLIEGPCCSVCGFRLFKVWPLKSSTSISFFRSNLVTGCALSSMLPLHVTRRKGWLNDSEIIILTFWIHSWETLKILRSDFNEILKPLDFKSEVIKTCKIKGNDSTFIRLIH